MDFIFGDPSWLYHPVLIIGKGIELGERILRKLFREKHLVLAGAVLWVFIAGVSFLIPLGLLFLAQKLHPGVRFALETFWCFQILAGRSLCRESGKVYDRLQEDDLPGARRAVSMIVGRDTESLTGEGVTKAAVETVAENTSDGVTAPLIYMMIGGAPLGFLYKAVNTLDSMVGYHNDKYEYLGKFSARMDDVFNFIPARLTAACMIAGAGMLHLDNRNALRIYRRDRNGHKSPNAGQTESVCAGALHVQLGGDASYFGKTVKKAAFGDPDREINRGDILRSIDLMTTASVFALVLCAVIRLTVDWPLFG